MIQAMFPEVRLRQLSITDSMPTSDYSTAYDARAAAALMQQLRWCKNEKKLGETYILAENELWQPTQ